jgi:hypothetical protein
MKCCTWSSVIHPVGRTVCQMCWMYPLFNESVGEVHFTSVLCTLLQYIAKIRKGIWKSFLAPPVEFIVHSQFWHLVTVRQGVCCYCLSSSFKYVLFSFLKEIEKITLIKKITNKLLTEKGSSWHTEPTSHTLREPNFLWTISSCFELCHSQTQQQAAILTISKITKGGIFQMWHNITFRCNQTLNTKYFIQLWQNTSCGVQNKAPNHASVIAHGALTLADRSQ